MNIKISGLDKLQRELKDAQRAFRSLDGTIATLKFDPNDRASVEAAIREMERAIESKVGSYRSNALVQQVAKGLKEKYRAAILERAAKSPTRNSRFDDFGPCKPSHEEEGEGQLEPCERGFDGGLEVLRQTSRAVDPPQGSLGNPSFW